MSLALLAAGCAGAQVLKLDDLVSEALARNPEILAAQKSLEAARQRPSQAGSLPDPMFSPGWNSNGNPLPGAQIGKNPTSNIGFSVTQEFPYPGKRRLLSNIARKDADAQSVDYQLVQLNVVSRMKQAFYQLHHTYPAREVLERNQQLLKNLLAVTEIRYSAGKAAQQDVFKAQVQLSLIEARLLQLDRERRLREAEINSLLDRPTGTPLPRPEDVHIMPIPKTLAELQAAAHESAPVRLRAQKMTEKAELAVNLARKNFYPDTALSAGYYNQAGMPAFYTFRADIKIPLYYRGKQRAAVTEQSQLMSQARHNYEAQGQSLNLRIADEYSTAETALQLINLYQKTILPQAGLTVDSSLASYESGAVDFLSVLNNYSAALDYEMDYHEQMQTYHSALARLEEITGVTLTEEAHQ